MIISPDLAPSLLRELELSHSHEYFDYIFLKIKLERNGVALSHIQQQITLPASMR